MKQSGRVSQDDGSTLVSAVAYTDPAEAVNRRESALDIGTSQNMMTSGEVSQDEIAAALAQSIDLPTPVSPTPSNLPPLGKLPQGLPPLGNIPPGMPPRANIPQGMPPVIPAKVVPNIPQVTQRQAILSHLHCLLLVFHQVGLWNNGMLMAICGLRKQVVKC